MTTNKAIQNSDHGNRSEDDRHRKKVVWFSEMAMVAGCILVFFGFLMVLIRVFFPSGTSLHVDPDTSILTDIFRSEQVELGLNAKDAALEPLFEGEILKIQRNVQYRSANSLAWIDADVGDRVVRNDAVQTFSRSTAVMVLNQDSQLTMGPNSLIVFNQQVADPFLTEQNTALVMSAGELSGKLSSAGKSPLRFDVKLPNSEVVLQPRTTGDDVGFLITVNDDESTTVNVHEGTAQIIARDGARKTIDEHQSVTIDPSGSELQVIARSRAPKTTGPANDMAVTYRNVPQQVQFTWNANADADRYHIVIARDKEFSDRVVDDDVVGTTFTHGALGAGTYYWFVRSRVGWSQSDRGTVRRLHMTQDLVPPALEVDPPPDTIQAGTWRLHGRTDEEAIVFIDEAPIEHQSGRIDHAIELRPGANLIVVKAVDDVGNLRYVPLLVNAK